jgi:hypothetical protein
MRKLAIMLSASALLLGLAAASANAQTQTGASQLRALILNATPVVKTAQMSAREILALQGGGDGPHLRLEVLLTVTLVLLAAARLAARSRAAAADPAASTSAAKRRINSP